ncbi:MAG: LamG domain-containing protein [Candidatus Omnitrophica bacterium]|nr:LamG domain-containing protein [Candidatus Omnitrophota bacterium]
MIKKFTFIFFTFILLCFCENGRIIYKGEGIFSFEELTVEMWIKFNFDPNEKTDKVWIPKGSILNFEIPEEKTIFSISCGLKAGRKGEEDSRCYLRIGFCIEGKEIPYPVLIDCSNFSNNWHHIAILWQEGKKLTIYIDGNEILKSSLQEKIKKDFVGKSKLIIGTPLVWFYENQIEIDEIRISSIARKKEELSIYKNIIDPYVLFYENFENIKEENGEIFTEPYIVSIESKGKYKIENGKIVEGKFGKGYLFSK